MVWPKSGSSTSSDTSVISSISAIEVAGISGRLVDSANSHAASTTKAGLADSEAWMLTPIRVIQRREPLTSGPISSVATISTMRDREHDQRGAADLPRRQERHPDQHDKGRQQEQDVAVEEVKRIEPDAGRHRRTGRERKDNAGQHQRDDRRQLQAVDGPPPFAERGALFTGEHGHSQRQRFAHWSPMMVSGRLMNSLSFEIGHGAAPRRSPYPAKAGYPVRRGLSVLSSLEYWFTRLRG